MTSINHYNNLCLVTLHFPTTSASGSGVPYCKSQETAIKEAKEALEKCKDNSEQKSKKEKDLKKLQSGLDEHIAKDHSLDESTRQAKMDEVKKQKEFVNNFKSNFNSALDGDILNNLCTGLETFLGFDPSSKGFTGEGIVYSDLDRLCDAVMGFLSGVLSNIEGHLGQHKDEITEAIEALKTNKHAGKKGFNEAIGSVVKGVGRYNTAVKGSNKKINDIIRSLTSNIEIQKNQSNEILKEKDENNVPINYSYQNVEKAVKLIDQKVDACLQQAEQYKSSIEAAQKNLNDLQPELKNKVEDSKSNIEYQRTELKRIHEHQKEELKGVITFVGRKLDGLGKCVNEEVVKKVDDLIKKLEKQISDIQVKLVKVYEHLEGYIKELDAWIETARKVIEIADRQVQLIEKEVNVPPDGGKNNKIEIEEAAGVIQTQIGKLFEQFEGVKGQYEKVYTLIMGPKGDGLEEGIRKDLCEVSDSLNVPDDLEVFTRRNEEWDVSRKLFGLTLQIEGNIEGYVRTILGEIKRDVGGVIGDAALGGIRKVVDSYIKEFGVNFRKTDDSSTVHKWVKDVAGKYPVKGYITSYIGNRPDGVTNIEKAITAAIIEIVDDSRSIKKPQATGSIQTDLEGISTFFTQFSKQLSGNLATNAISDMVKKVRDAAQEAGYPIPSYGTDHLQHALIIILQFVSTVASNIADKFNRLLINNSDTARMINEALTTANGLYLNVGEALQDSTGATFVATEPVRLSDNVANRIKEKIKAADKHLKDLVKEACKKGIENLQKEVQKIVETKLEKITKLPPAVELNANKANTDIVVNSHAIANKFSSLCYTIQQAAGDKYKDGLKKKLQELKDLINNMDATINNKNQKGLHEIKNELSRLQNGMLKQAIEDTEKLLKIEAPRFQKECTKHLKSHVISQVNSAQAAITQELRSRYVRFLKAQLTSFADKCQDELSTLPAAITADADKGAKGFMKRMEGTVGRLEKNTDVSVLSTSSSIVITALTDYVKHQIDGKIGTRSDVKSLYFFIQTMFEQLAASKHFNHEFSEHLRNLNTKLNELTPKKFGEESTALLQGLKEGMLQFTAVLADAYINVYEGSAPMDQWTEDVPDSAPKTVTKGQADAPRKPADPPAVPNTRLTTDGRRGAKVFLTITPMLWKTLEHLKEQFEKERSEWKTYKMYDTSRRKSGLSSLFFAEHGYDLNVRGEAAHGELNHKEGFKGQNIYEHLTKEKNKLFIASRSVDVSSVSPSDVGALQVEVADGESVIENLYAYLHDYFKVCHYKLPDSPRDPCSIYEMLLWGCGLQFNPVYVKLENHTKNLFMVEDKNNAGNKTLKPFEAYPSAFTNTDIDKYIYDVSSECYAVLVSFLGHGHAGGIYASDFSANTYGFSYPSDPGKCFDLLAEIFNKLYHQLFFVYKQCSYPMEYGGWLNCWYGQGIGGSNWKCNELQCPNPAGNQIANQSNNQIGNQNAQQNCDRHPKCGLKSPLQSFLEDGLVGFLPHHLTSVGCGAKCSAGNHKGLPCKTPMGFSDLTDVASHRQSGRELSAVLSDFCGNKSSCLATLCGNLTCLLNKTPETLGDMFSFYYKFLYGWASSGQHRKEAFDESVDKANFKRHYDKLNVYAVFDSTHSSYSKSHSNGDLVSLVCDSTPSGRCGPYLYSLYNEIGGIFSNKHADKYLSWIVHLTPTFYDLLKKLYDDCCKSCGGDKPKCRVAKCPPNCATTKNNPNTNHSEICKSILQCDRTSSVLCRYGFALSDRKKLSGTEHPQCKRTCKDLCEMLKKVLEEESVLMKLFHSIDKFIYTIRFPFMTLTLSLWLLSLLYLTHIMVIRLDLLHIKSHLHSPSSHRIAAQSLLAAARVNKLGKVFYLQP